VSGKEGGQLAQSMTFAERCSFTLVYYAAERTLMSWIRAALGMMALGFVIDRFGLVLRMLPVHDGNLPSTEYSFWTGSVLVFGGAAMAFTAAIRYAGIEKRYRREGCDAPGHGLPLGVFYTALVGIVGIVLGFILAAVRY
jgi:inner membrane protein YidH